MTKQVWKINWTTADKMEVSTKLLKNNRKCGPILKGVFSIMDRLRFKAQMVLKLKFKMISIVDLILMSK